MDRTTWTCKFTRRTQVATVRQKNAQLKEVFSERILWWTWFASSVMWTLKAVCAVYLPHHPLCLQSLTGCFVAILSELCANYKCMLSNPTVVCTSGDVCCTSSNSFVCVRCKKLPLCALSAIVCFDLFRPPYKTKSAASYTCSFNSISSGVVGVLTILIIIIKKKTFASSSTPQLTNFKSTQRSFCDQCRRLTPSALGRGWPLIPTVRNGECVDKRLSHSLGLCSGTASIKFLLSSLMLAWCFRTSSLGLSKSYRERGEMMHRGEGRGAGRWAPGNLPRWHEDP